LRDRNGAALPSRKNLWRACSVIAALGLLLGVGCAEAPPPGPSARDAALTYLAALKGGDYQTCYRMMAEKDLVNGSLDGFLGEIPMGPEVERRWFGQLEAATEYRVGTARERGSEAIVPVNVTTPNLVLWERMLGARNETRQAVQARAEKQLANGDYPRLSYPDLLVMIREGDEWHVLAGFAQRARILRMREQALAAYHQLEYNQALVLYQQMLVRIAKAPFSASGELICMLTREMKRIEAARAGVVAAQFYLPKVWIKDVESKLTVAGPPGLFGQLVNSGDRSLDEVELTVSYYSDAGKLIYSERHTPIAMPLEFTDFDLPIVPFAPGETREIGITLKAPVEVQQQYKPQMTVSGVIFSEPLAVPPKLAGSATAAADIQPSSPAAPAPGASKPDVKRK